MEELVKTIIENWQVSIVVGVAGILLARAFTFLIMIILGFYLGAYVLYPMAYQNIDALKEFVADPQKQYIAFWVFGVIGALGMTIIYKVALFAVGFLAVGMISYFAYGWVDQNYNISQYITFMDPEMFKIALVAVLGAIGGFYFASKERVVSKWIAIGIGSAVSSITIVHIYKIFVEKVSFEESYKFILSQTGLYVVLGLFFVLLILGSLIHRNRKTV